MSVTKRTVEVIDHVATGKSMKALREKAGKTGAQVGAALGFSAPMVFMLEAGERNWTDDLCERFQKALKK